MIVPYTESEAAAVAWTINDWLNMMEPVKGYDRGERTTYALAICCGMALQASAGAAMAAA